ncbi:hypothetical protein J6590_055265 [Homalodisca vitripennis]|nr:hypothetical protein J6590_055265 [Homalodisca vitripennis]
MFGSEGDCSGLLTLHYGKHHTSLVNEIRQWFDAESFADVRLLCRDQGLLAHRLVLASASPLLRRLLEDCGTTMPTVTIQLPDITAAHMKSTLDFLYTGQACIQPTDIQGVVEVFELLEIKSEFWGGKPSTESNTDQPDVTVFKDLYDKTSWATKPSGQEETSAEENVEPSSVKESVSASGSSSESTSTVCASAAVKTEVEVDVDVCSEEEPPSEKRRRSSSSLFPVNLSLSNPDNKEHSNLNSPVSDRDSRVVFGLANQLPPSLPVFTIPLTRSQFPQVLLHLVLPAIFGSTSRSSSNWIVFPNLFNQFIILPPHHMACPPKSLALCFSYNVWRLKHLSDFLDKEDWAKDGSLRDTSCHGMRVRVRPECGGALVKCVLCLHYLLSSFQCTDSPRRKSSSVIEAGSGEESQPELPPKPTAHLFSEQSQHRKRKSRYMEDYRTHLEDDDNRKLPDEVINQPAPENYVVTPHRKRRPGFHNAPAQNPPFVPFSPCYIEEISYRPNRNNHPLSSSAPPYLMDNSSKSSLHLQLPNAVDDLVKFRPPSGDGHPSMSPRSNSYPFGMGNSTESSWGPWAICQAQVGQTPTRSEETPNTGVPKLWYAYPLVVRETLPGGYVSRTTPVYYYVLADAREISGCGKSERSFVLRDEWLHH